MATSAACPRKRFRNVSTVSAVIGVIVVGQLSTSGEAHESQQQPFECGRLPEAGWVDGEVAQRLFEVAQQMVEAASTARSAYHAAVQRRFGSADAGEFSRYYSSALEVAADAVRFDPADAHHMLLFADLHFDSSDLGDGQTDVERARQSLVLAECAVVLSESVEDAELERRARWLVSRVRGAIQTHEPG